MEKLINQIKKKKELSDVSEILVKDVLEHYLQKNNLKIPKDKKGIKIIVKDVRCELRNYTGRFQVKISPKKREELLEKDNLIELLKSHSSTRERLESNSYEILIESLKEISPKSILDLACGINPLKISLEFPKSKYYATDIKESELNLLKNFFRKNNIEGEAFVSDIRKKKNYPAADVCLILKVLDIIEKKGHRKSQKLLKNLHSKNLIISFSTKTLSGKQMKFPQRSWLEKILIGLNYSFKIKKSSNELFYFCKKLSCEGICSSSN